MIRPFVVLIWAIVIPSARASVGDRHVEYTFCVQKCLKINCSSEDLLKQFYDNQSLTLKLTGWSCSDECDHQCMWVAVDKIYAHSNFVPQFHGKWPFIRVLGLQEPASVLFSLLNLLSFCFMASTFYRKLPKQFSMKILWQTYSVLGVFTWICSAVFHARDYPWTEKMDYFCAFASITFGLFACLCRLIGADKRWKICLVGIPLLVYFVCHVTYLSRYKFDYGYNLKAGVTFGVINSIAWLFWSFYRYGRYKASYVLNCCFVVVCGNCLILLEILDFPPIFWIFDAHSLWHLGTSPLPLFWTKFVLDDARYSLLEEEQKKSV